MSAAAPAPASPGHAERPVGVIVAILALGGISVALMQTLVIPIVGQLPVYLGTSASNASWAITATLLAGAVATPIAGRLGDMFGKRPLLLASLAAMVIGSVVCALSDSLTPMIVGRALQGFAAGVIPLGISLMRDILPAEKLGPATALMSASLGVGGALGLPGAALIADNLDWHWLFWVAGGLGAIVFVLVLTLIPSAAGAHGGRIDLLGAVGLSVTLVAILLGVSKGRDWGWASGETLACLIGGTVLAVLWGFWELRSREPLVDLRTTARPQVLLTNLASVALGFAMFAMSLVIPQIIQLPTQTGYGLGKSMLTAGLAMLPAGLVMMVTAPISANVTRRHGPKVSLMIGGLVVAIGYAVGVFFTDAVWQLSIVTGIIGAGVGFAYGSMPALIMSAVPVRETASANSFNTLVRSIGSSVASAVSGAVLASSAVVAGGVAIPAERGFKTILIVASGAALLAVVIAALIPRAQPATEAPAAVDTTPTKLALPEPSSVPQQRPSPTLAVRGNVTTGGSRPLAGAVLTLTDSAGRQVARGTSTENGAYELPVPTGGTYLLITAAGHLSPHATLVAVGSSALTHDVTLAGRSALTGRVQQERSGVPGALVTLTDVTGRVVGSTTTDAEGGYTFDGLSGGTYVLTTRSGRSRPTARSTEVGDDEALVVDLLLGSGGRVTGTVTAGAGSTAHAGATVTLVDATGRAAEVTTTDVDGRYEFSDVAGGNYTVTASSWEPATRDVRVDDGLPADADLHLGGTTVHS
ncbi:MFS transporter [Kineococcus sp. NBC_00420]|uniref:MFS transporter n=1 Tax=Kineococcus sp. NBC_00420 TaxID=2903564 RepID=UPI002E1BDF8D